MKFFDYRFRQFAVVDTREIEGYYREKFLPELAARGIEKQPSLAEVEEKIRGILTEEKVNLQIDVWLKSLKESASIEISIEHMSTRTKIVLTLVVSFALFLVLLLTFLNSNTFREQLKNQIIGRLDEITGGRSSIDRVQVHFFPLRIQIDQLTIPGNGTILSPPFLSVQKMRPG